MALAALAERDCKPRVAAPNNMTAPSKNETSVFIVNVPFEDLSATAFRNAHANLK